MKKKLIAFVLTLVIVAVGGGIFIYHNQKTTESTKQVVDKVLDSSHLVNLLSYNDMESGVEHLEEEYDEFKELSSREDSVDELLDAYDRIDNLDEVDQIYVIQYITGYINLHKEKLTSEQLERCKKYNLL